MEKKLKTIEFILEDESGNVIGDVSAISIVSNPAIEVSAHFFNKNLVTTEQQFKITNQEKRIITSVAMRHSKKILRLDENTGEYYYAWFSPETIEKAMQLFSKNGGYGYATIEHTPEKIRDIYIVESWKIGKNDKIYDLGFSSDDASEGDWAVSFRVEDEEKWEQLKQMKEANPNLGFSIESVFSFQQFADVDTIIDTVTKNEPGETPTQIEEHIEDKIEDKPKSKNKKEILKELVEEILSSDKMGKDEMVRLLKKISENI